MSIWTGRDYDIVEDFNARTEKALNGVVRLFNNDAHLDGVNSDAVEWLKKETAGKRILEIGCGYGRYSAILPFKSYVGIDITAARVDYASKNYASDNVKFHLVEDNWDIGQFDLACCVHVIHHLTMPQAIDLIKNAKKHTKRLLAQEACLDYMTEGEAEQRYLKSPHHMIWKPIQLIECATDTKWKILKKLSKDSQALIEPVRC